MLLNTRSFLHFPNARYIPYAQFLTQSITPNQMPPIQFVTANSDKPKTMANGLQNRLIDGLTIGFALCRRQPTVLKIAFGHTL
jgi:hypothetical protein